MRNTSPVKNPGGMRIVKMYGGAGSHTALISSPTYSGLINYSEENAKTEAFATMQGKTNVTVVGDGIFQVVRTWDNP